MKPLILYLLVFWFYFNINRSLAYFSECYLYSTTECPDCSILDLNNDNIVNLVDYAMMTGE